MKWSSAFATGVEQIDDQHKMIFKLAEDFQVALDEGRGDRVYAGLLQSLDLYVRTHFGNEERCMERHRCPVARTNQEAHAKFVGVLAEYRELHSVKGFDRADARALVETIDNWLSDHICRIDVQLKRSVEQP